jgi:hypothetical protein
MNLKTDNPMIKLTASIDTLIELETNAVLIVKSISKP